jgi:hypothetical protein
MLESFHLGKHDQHTHFGKPKKPGWTTLRLLVSINSSFLNETSSSARVCTAVVFFIFVLSKRDVINEYRS